MQLGISWCAAKCAVQHAFLVAIFHLCVSRLNYSFNSQTEQVKHYFSRGDQAGIFQSPESFLPLWMKLLLFNLIFSSWFLEFCLWFLLIVLLCFLCYWKMAQCTSVIAFLLSLHQSASNLSALTYWFKKAQWKLLLKVSSLWFNCSRGSQKGSRILKRDCIMKCSTSIHIPSPPQSESTNEPCTYEHLIEMSVENK